MKSVRPLAVPPVAYIENATADAVVDVIYPAMTYRKGYTEFKADNLPRQGRVEYISPRGWARVFLPLRARHTALSADFPTVSNALQHEPSWVERQWDISAAGCVKLRSVH